MELQILLAANAYRSANSVEADARLENLEAVKKILRSVIPGFNFEFVGTSIAFPIKLSQLKALLPQLKKHTNLIDVAPLICADVEQRFCVKNSDGSFSVFYGTIVEDQCERAPPPSSVDLSFCAGIP